MIERKFGKIPHCVFNELKKIINVFNRNKSSWTRKNKKVAFE